MNLSLQILTAFALIQPPVGADSNRDSEVTEKKSPVVVPAVAEGSIATKTAPVVKKQNTLGVRVKAIPDLLRSQLGDVIPAKTGVMVSAVQPGSATDSSGLKQHDMVLKFAGKNVVSPAHLKKLVVDAKLGSTVEVTVLRSLKTHTISVQLGTRSMSIAADGPAAFGPRPSGRPRHYCKVEIVFESDEQLQVTTEQCIDGAPTVRNHFTGSIAEIAAHYENAPAVVRNNISICLQTARPNQRKNVRNSVRILPRVENQIRFIRFVNVRTTANGLPSVYVYDKRMGVTVAPGSLAGVTEDKAVRDELDKLPKPIRERIDQTVRQFKDAASVRTSSSAP